MKYSGNFLFAGYAIGSIGALLQITGGYWDVSWHIRRLVESFFTPAHTVLYAGVSLVGLSAIIGIFLEFSSSQEEKPLLIGLKLAVVGVGLQAFAGFFDNWWHGVYGFDPVLFSPPHAVLIFGMAVNGFAMTVGTTKLLGAETNSTFNFSPYLKKPVQILAIAAFTALWLDLNAVVYLLTDVQGMAFTFKFGTSFARQNGQLIFVIGSGALGLTGVSVLLAAKKVLGWRGAMTLVATGSAAITALTNIAFRGFLGFLPLYFTFLVPVCIFDLLLPEIRWDARVLISAIPLGLLAFYLDGWYSLTVWSSGNMLGLFLLAPMLTGLVGTLFVVRPTGIAMRAAGSKP